MLSSTSESPPAIPSTPALWLSRAALACALAVSATVLFFFIWGISDGSVSSFNSTLWLILVAVAAGVPIIGWVLHSGGKIVAAIAVLSVLVLPGMLYLLFLICLANMDFAEFADAADRNGAFRGF